MNRKILIVLVALSYSFITLAQKFDEALLTVGSETVSSFEFEQIFLKNNQMVGEADRKSLEEYLDLFIIYKLKVAEAKAQGLQNSEAFKQEFASYRTQLVQPHLVDTETEEKLLKEAYERMKYEVSASHILIALPNNASAEDTLRTFNKTLGIRERILKGESFESVARATSDDPSVKENGGNLGYFTVFQMVYPFESAAYTTPVDSLSMPVRTNFGYHLVKVNDVRQTQGQLRTAHIMVATPPNFTEKQRHNAKALIDSIYGIALTNEDFGKLASRYSQDPGSARNGGELPWFGLRAMVPEFEKASFALDQAGDISKPISTKYGWHIIKLLEKRGVGAYEEMLPEIKSRMARDARGRMSKSNFISKLKEKYVFELDTNSLHTMVLLLDSTLFRGQWAMPDRYKNRFMFGFAGQIHTLSELGERISRNQSRLANIPFDVIVNRLFDDLVSETVLAYEENRLISETPEIFFLLKEYHDGILLFEIMEQQVWQRASHDNEGLETFFKQNISNYSWEKRIHAQLFMATNERDAKRGHRLANSNRGARLSEQEFVKRFISKNDTLLAINPIASLPNDQLVEGYELWHNSISPIKTCNGSYCFVRFQRVVENEPKTLNEVRGQVIADYQEYLEKEWIKSLREKHPVNLNEKLFESIISNLN